MLGEDRQIEHAGQAGDWAGKYVVAAARNSGRSPNPPVHVRAVKGRPELGDERAAEPRVPWSLARR